MYETGECFLEGFFEIPNGFPGILASHAIEALASKWEEHRDVHHIGAIRIVIKFSGFPGSDKFLPTHVQTLPRRTIQEIHSFFAGQLANLSVGRLYGGRHGLSSSLNA
jgi:hypothetical protein